MSKPRIVKDYEKLPEAVMEQIKLVYPRGFSNHLVSFTNQQGEKKMGLPFETEEYYYLIRMTTNKAENLIRIDDDYDDDGILKTSVKADYADKHDDADFLDELNSNDDNDLGLNDEDIDDEVDPDDLPGEMEED